MKTSREQQIGVRVRDDERALLERAAGFKCQSVSEWLRQVGIRAAERLLRRPRRQS